MFGGYTNTKATDKVEFLDLNAEKRLWRVVEQVSLSQLMNVGSLRKKH